MDNNKKDIQGLILRTFGTKKFAKYFLIKLKDAVKARKWLKDTLPMVTSAAHQSDKPYMNIAFTYEGLQKLQLPKSILETFAREFVEGALTPHRLRMLGDIYENAPDQWHWGAHPEDVHMAVLLYANEETQLQHFEADITENGSSYGFEKTIALDTLLLPENKEHFGFRDGIAQPEIEDFQEVKIPENATKPGEFLLGYPNEYDRMPESPQVSTDLDKQNILKSTARQGFKDFGKNGSYMVFRQLEQDVPGFWQYLQGQAQKLGEQDPVYLGAKLVGRWPNGTPVTKCPFHHTETSVSDDNNFGYFDQDYDGFNCPVGAHVRRVNPRDAFTFDKQKSIQFTKRHRILRRSRPYGQPLSPNLDPAEMTHNKDDQKRGIHFICFNANIGRQFEFIQQTWVNNPKFEALNMDPDPLMGNQELQHEGEATFFTIQGKPFRQRMDGVKGFVKVKGSAYFFMPSINALEYLAYGIEDGKS
jgi:Dyp-type peroxidase family